MPACCAVNELCNAVGAGVRARACASHACTQCVFLGDGGELCVFGAGLS